MKLAEEQLDSRTTWAELTLLSMPRQLLERIVLRRRNWYVTRSWRQIRGPNLLSYHGPRGEFQPMPPGDITAAARAQLVEEILRKQG